MANQILCGAHIELLHTTKIFLLLVTGQLRQDRESFHSHFHLRNGQLVVWLGIVYYQQVLSLFVFQGLAIEEATYKGLSSSHIVSRSK